MSKNCEKKNPFFLYEVSCLRYFVIAVGNGQPVMYGLICSLFPKIFLSFYGQKSLFDWQRVSSSCLFSHCKLLFFLLEPQPFSLVWVTGMWLIYSAVVCFTQILFNFLCHFKEMRTLTTKYMFGMIQTLWEWEGSLGLLVHPHKIYFPYPATLPLELSIPSLSCMSQLYMLPSYQPKLL